MKLLIVTQKVNKSDPILGFFHRWIEEFAKNVEKLTVICLEEGEYGLPDNARVLSLGKEDHVSRFTYIFRFYKYILNQRKEYDAVFVHMNPIYVVLGGFVWKMFGKRIGLWYTHKNVDIKLRLAEEISDIVFTASKESFRLGSNKLKVMGHGIDPMIFHSSSGLKSERKVIVTSGRISPTKNIRLMIEAFSHMTVRDSSMVIVGSPTTDMEKSYKGELDALVSKLGVGDRVFFTGNKSQEEVADILRSADLFINLSNTGSLDKAVLEAMASGVYTLSSNEAFRNTADQFLDNVTVSNLSRIMDLALRENRIGSKREHIESEHNLGNLIKRIILAYEQ
jgi:glycosyltransferase involved in cell wall biosynthesis